MTYFFTKLRKNLKKFWSFTKYIYICSPKVKEISFTHADVVKW